MSRGSGRAFERADHRRALAQRSEALRAIREFFHRRGFLEIEPSLVVDCPGMELHIDAVEVGDRFLISSPEYQMKRLLVEGLERIFALCRCFRAGERGQQHSVEFSMLEWYRAGETLDAILRDTEELVAEVALRVAGEAVVEVDGRRIPVEPPFDVTTVGALFREHAGVELRGDESADELARAIAAAGLEVGTARHWDDLFYTVFVDHIDPVIARHPRPLFVVDWPLRLGALARAKVEEPAVVERFELYIGGVELANAFGELTCAREQRARLVAERGQRAERGKPAYPIDERFLAALEQGMPEAAGIALGVDRLVMLVTGAGHIAEVQAFGDGEV